MNDEQQQRLKAARARQNAELAQERNRGNRFRGLKPVLAQHNRKVKARAERSEDGRYYGEPERG